MKKLKNWYYLGLPILGCLFYLIYLNRSSIDMVYSDYIRLINSYLPDVWNPKKFFVADLLTRIPVNFLERGINVMLFGYSVAFDRVMGVCGFGFSALVIACYCKKKELSPVWYGAMMVVMFSLNKWEMLYNGTGWAHFLAFGLFFFHYVWIDTICEKGFSNVGREKILLLMFLPFLITIGSAGPYCAIYTVTLVLTYLFLLLRDRVYGILNQERQKRGSCEIGLGRSMLLISAAVLPFLIYLWSNSQAVYEYSGAVSTPILTALGENPKFFVKFFLKSFASMAFGVEWIDRNCAGIPGKVWCAVGLLVLAAYFLALWMNFYYRIQEETILPLMLLAAGGMNHLMVLISRYIFMPNDAYGMSSRYALQYQVGIIGIFLTFSWAAKRKTPDQKDRLDSLVKGLCLGLSVLFLAGNLMTTAEEFRFGKYRKEHNRDEVKAVLLNFENETDETLQNALEYHKPGCREALTILKENGWNIWRTNQ